MPTITTTMREFRRQPVAGILSLGFLLVSCERPTAQSGGTTGPPSIPLPAAEAKVADRHREIDELIEKLAISDEPAGDEPVYTPDLETPRTDKRVIAYEAAEKLREYGKAAFAQLLARRHDKRQSVAFRRVIPHTVGLACYCIVEDVIYNLPEDYRGSFYRKGGDGEMHERPRFLAPGIFDEDTVEAWLRVRHDKTLTELQIEALEWLIDKEKNIGFPTERDREKFLLPLERQVSRLRAIQET